jgi:hypothetical protein
MASVIALRAHRKAYLPVLQLRTKHHRVHQLRTQLQAAAEVDTKVAANLMVAVVVVDMTVAGGTNPRPLNQAAS